MNFWVLRDMYPFRPLKSEPRSVNYQNTVIILRENDVCLLGYVQDFKGNELFINFDSVTTPPSWIRLQNVWPHNLVSRDLAAAVGEKGHAAVFVALRDEEDGPYRFRPAKLLSTMLWTGLYYAQVDSAGDGSYEYTLVVHRLQITSMLPSQKPPSFDRMPIGFAYIRHVIPFENVPLPSSTTEAVSGHELFSHLSSQRTQEEEEDWEERLRDWMRTIDYTGCRFRMLLEMDKLVFTCTQFDSHALNEMLGRWESQIFVKELFEKYHSDAYKSYPAGTACTLSNPGMLSPTCFMDHDLDLCIGNLSKPLHMDILYIFDLHIQAKMKRVCAAWYLLLTDSATYKDIVIDIEKLERNYSPLRQQCSTAYMLGFLTDQTVTARTRSLTLAKGTLCFGHGKCVLTELLQLKRIKLPRIILKDWLCDLFTSRFDKKARFGLRCGYLFDYFTVCESLLILTTCYAVENIFYNVEFLRPANEVPDMPEQEAKFLANRLQFMSKPEASVLIPRLIFYSDQNTEHILRNILSAIENNFPAVCNSMYDEVKAIWNRWVLGLKYPEEWRVIRDILCVFNGLHTDGSRQKWNDTDLRNLDVFRLNKLTLTFINGHFSEKNLQYYPYY